MKSNRFTLALILLAVMPILFYGCKQAQTPEEPAYDTIALEPEPEPDPGDDDVWNDASSSGSACATQVPTAATREAPPAPLACVSGKEAKARSTEGQA